MKKKYFLKKMCWNQKKKQSRAAAVAINILSASSHKRRVSNTPFQRSPTTLESELNTRLSSLTPADDVYSPSDRQLNASTYVTDPLSVLSSADRAFLAFSPLFQVLLETLEVKRIFLFQTHLFKKIFLFHYSIL